MNLARKINLGLFFTLWPFVQILIWITFLVALAHNEMDLSSHRLFNGALLLFNVFKWPTLFFYGDTYFPLFLVLIGLAINSLIYALLLERIIAGFRALSKRH